MHRIHTSPRIMEWMHVAQDKGSRAVHSTEHMLHERTFWVVLTALAFATLLLLLSVMFGGEVAVDGYTIAPPYFGP